MKKFAFVLVSLFLMGAVAANAQGVIVKGGYNYSKSNVKEIRDGHSGWQFGVGYQTGTSMGFSFQPEVLYKVAGLKLSDAADLRLTYLEVPLNVQWGPDLLIARPFIFGGPFVGYAFKPSGKGIDDEVARALRKFEWGVGAGIGINVWKIQIAGKYNWNFGSFADVESAQGALAHFDNLAGNPRTFEISVGLKF
ncbi:MAG: PorT family protein [Bacteroidales bacterium]|nr:PorT family protein [Bacteroidales bacterium]